MAKKTYHNKGINASVVFALAMAVLAFVILGVMTSVGASIQSGIYQTQCSGGSSNFNTTSGLCYAVGGVHNLTTTASNISIQGMSGIKNIGDQLPLMGTIIVFGAVIALLLAVFWIQGRNASSGKAGSDGGF